MIILGIVMIVIGAVGSVAFIGLGILIPLGILCFILGISQGRKDDDQMKPNEPPKP